MGPCVRGAFQLGANYAQNTNAVSDANGRLTVSLTNSGFVAFNGLQVFGNIPPVGYLNLQAGPNNTVILTWSSAAGYTLQTSTNVSGPWNASGLTPVLQNGQYVVTNTAAGGAMFYRLVH
jgi:hypothetical protein